MQTTDWIVRIGETYGGIGLAIAAVFLLHGINRVDPSAHGAFAFRCSYPVSCCFGRSCCCAGTLSSEQGDAMQSPRASNLPGWPPASSTPSPRAGAVVVLLAGDERVAVFRHKGRLPAVSNLCAHQNGPLGEGKVIGGCITCPWHGFTC